MIEGMGLQVAPNPNFDAYYGLIDFEFWARKNIGDEAVEYLKKNVHPLDLAFRLAEAHGIVLLNGGGFEAPELVDARLAGEPARRSLRGYRPRRSDDCARLSGRIRSVEGRGEKVAVPKGAPGRRRPAPASARSAGRSGARSIPARSGACQASRPA